MVLCMQINHFIRLNKTQYKGGKLWIKVKGQTTGQTNH